MLAHAILFQYQRTYIYHVHVVVELASSKQASKQACQQAAISKQYSFRAACFHSDAGV
jgi:hypothetical protein